MSGQFIEENVKDAVENPSQIPKRFKNTVPVEKTSLMKTLGLMFRFFTERKVHNIPSSALPVQPITREALDCLSNDGFHFVKLGHSSLLLKVLGEYWLLDPVFGKRASPFSFIGPKRFHDAPVSIDDLPPIDKVLISHNHYDHLDEFSVRKLAHKTKQFLVPLGVDSDLQKWGVSADKIISFDWWQSLDVGPNKVVFTPTKHFSGRGLTDANKSLWGSWVIDSPAGKVFFSGDSGYFPGFAEIGRKYGPFDVTFIETGAYDKDWSDIHMTPEESVQAHIDLKGQVMVPIHNGTFDLAFHAWYEPFERVLSAANQHEVQLSTPIVGETLDTQYSLIKSRWWRALIPSQK